MLMFFVKASTFQQIDRFSVFLLPYPIGAMQLWKDRYDASMQLIGQVLTLLLLSASA